MCLSAQALILFISLLPQDIVATSPSEVRIAAGTGPVVWENFDDRWCTVAPLLARGSATAVAN